MRGALLMACFWVVTTTSVLAFDGKTPVYFFNVTTCGQYADDRKEPPHAGMNAVDQMYVGGWLSAANLYQPGQMFLEDGDIPSAMLWLDNYCKANPFSSLQAGLIELVRQHAATPIPAK